MPAEFLHPEIEREYKRWIDLVGPDDPYRTEDCVGLHDVLQSHFLIADSFVESGNGIGGIGPKSLDLLHSAIYRQFVSFGGKDKWTGPLEKCATLVFGLVKAKWRVVGRLSLGVWASYSHSLRVTDLGPLPLTLIASLVLAVVLLAIRVFVMQRIQRRRQRENKQETERLKSLVAAYRSLAGSFSPVSQEHTTQIEETLADIVLFGPLHQVELAVLCATRLKRGEAVDYQPLIEALRSDLRTQLGLEPIPKSLVLPVSGPGRPMRSTRGEGEGGGRGEARSGGGAGGGGGAAAGAGGLSVGLIAADVSSQRDQP